MSPPTRHTFQARPSRGANDDRTSSWPPSWPPEWFADPGRFDNRETLDDWIAQILLRKWVAQQDGGHILKRFLPRTWTDSDGAIEWCCDPSWKMCRWSAKLTAPLHQPTSPSLILRFPKHARTCKSHLGAASEAALEPEIVVFSEEDIFHNSQIRKLSRPLGQREQQSPFCWKKIQPDKHRRSVNALLFEHFFPKWRVQTVPVASFELFAGNCADFVKDLTAKHQGTIVKGHRCQNHSQTNCPWTVVCYGDGVAYYPYFQHHSMRCSDHRFPAEHPPQPRPSLGSPPPSAQAWRPSYGSQHPWPPPRPWSQLAPQHSKGPLTLDRSRDPRRRPQEAQSKCDKVIPTRSQQDGHPDQRLKESLSERPNDRFEESEESVESTSRPRKRRRDSGQAEQDARASLSRLSIDSSQAEAANRQHPMVERQESVNEEVGHGQSDRCPASSHQSTPPDKGKGREKQADDLRPTPIQQPPRSPTKQETPRGPQPPIKQQRSSLPPSWYKSESPAVPTLRIKQEPPSNPTIKEESASPRLGAQGSSPQTRPGPHPQDSPLSPSLTSPTLSSASSEVPPARETELAHGHGRAHVRGVGASIPPKVVAGASPPSSSTAPYATEGPAGATSCPRGIAPQKRYMLFADLKALFEEVRRNVSSATETGSSTSEAALARAEDDFHDLVVSLLADRPPSVQRKAPEGQPMLASLDSQSESGPRRCRHCEAHSPAAAAASPHHAPICAMHAWFLNCQDFERSLLALKSAIVHADLSVMIDLRPIKTATGQSFIGSFDGFEVGTLGPRRTTQHWVARPASKFTEGQEVNCFFALRLLQDGDPALQDVPDNNRWI